MPDRSVKLDRAWRLRLQLGLLPGYQRGKDAFLEEPAAVLKEPGVEVPEVATVLTFEDVGNTIVLPVAHERAETELSGEALASVVGGLVGPSDYDPKLKSSGSFSSLKIDATGGTGKDDGTSRGIVAPSS